MPLAEVQRLPDPVVMVPVKTDHIPIMHFHAAQIARATAIVSNAASANSPSVKTCQFGQPVGRPRKGHTWNTDVGIWVPDNAARMTQFFSRIDPKTSE